MTTRERWIVYPLLFLALGIVVRDKLIPPIHKTVVSQEIRAGSIRCGDIKADRAEFKTMASD
jgi:hypothetical protein